MVDTDIPTGEFRWKANEREIPAHRLLYLRSADIPDFPKTFAGQLEVKAYKYEVQARDQAPLFAC